jgi:hypothetical protein
MRARFQTLSVQQLLYISKEGEADRVLLDRQFTPCMAQADKAK